MFDSPQTVEAATAARQTLEDRWTADIREFEEKYGTYIRLVTVDNHSVTVMACV